MPPTRARKSPRRPADRRGKYDRTLAPDARRAQQLAALLAAATHVFGTAGIAGATVEAIVSRAGMGRPTFYEHFDDLKACLGQVHTSLAEQAFQLISLVVSSVADPLERVRAGVQAYFAAVALNPLQARVLFREIRNAGPDFERRWELETLRFSGLLHAALAAAHAKGDLGVMPDDIAVHVLTTGLESVGIRYLNRGAEGQLPEIAPRLAELVIRAFR